MKIPEVILIEINSRKMKPSELADGAKVSRAKIYDWFSGKKKLSEDNIEKIISFLDLELVKTYKNNSNWKR